MQQNFKDTIVDSMIVYNILLLLCLFQGRVVGEAINCQKYSREIKIAWRDGLWLLLLIMLNPFIPTKREE